MVGSERRKSLGFDSVRIEMKPPLTTSVPKYGDVKFVQSNERSNIPQPPKLIGSHITTRLQTRFADVKNRLEKKTKINLYDIEQNLKEDLALRRSNLIEQKSRDRELDVELAHLQSTLNDLELDNDELRRAHKKLKHRIIEMTSEIEKSIRKFEYRGEIIMQNVSNRERLIDINLQELSNKYKDEFNEAKFQLDIELKNSHAYKDDNLQQEIVELERKVGDIADQLESGKTHKHEVIKSESGNLQKEVAEYLDLKTTEANELTSLYEIKDSELQQIDKKILEIENNIRSKQNHNEAIRESIVSLKEFISKSEAEKSSLEMELESVQMDVESIQQIENEWDTKLNQVKNNYGDTINKLNKHNQQKRVLENSIMDYEGKLRVYVKLPLDMKIDNGNSFVANKQIHQYNKVLDGRCSNHDVIEEFICLTKNVVSGNNVSVIFLGSPHGTHQLILDTLKLSYQTFVTKQECLSKNGWEFEFNLRVLAITTNDDLVDYLSSCEIMPLSKLHSNLNQLPSQKMILESADSINQLSQFHPGKQFKSVAYIIEVVAKNSTSMKQFESNLLLVDITCNSLVSQCRILSEKGVDGPFLPDMIKYATCFSKCLNIGILDSVDTDSVNLLKVLDVINNTDSPFKRK